MKPSNWITRSTVGVFFLWNLMSTTLPLRADTIIALGGDWSNSANWVGGAPPGLGDMVIIPATAQDSTVDVDFTVASLEIESGFAATVTQQADLTVLDTLGIFIQSGTFSLMGGTLVVPTIRF